MKSTLKTSQVEHGKLDVSLDRFYRSDSTGKKHHTKTEIIKNDSSAKTITEIKEYFSGEFQFSNKDSLAIIPVLVYRETKIVEQARKKTISHSKDSAFQNSEKEISDSVRHSSKSANAKYFDSISSQKEKVKQAPYFLILILILAVIGFVVAVTKFLKK